MEINCANVRFLACLEGRDGDSVKIKLFMYRVSQNYPNMQFFRDFRHCAETAHQESKLYVRLSPSQHIIPFRH